ncbi:MAG: hypothetical protein ABI877_14095, partial [Gemmatimonadaceae bacterium]
MGPEIIVPIGFFATVAICVVGVSMARAIARHADVRRIDSSPDVTARLDRMEQAIDAIAVEVERVSEAQRFTTRLLTERAGT